MNLAPRSLPIHWIGILVVTLALTSLACLSPAVVSPTPSPSPLPDEPGIENTVPPAKLPETNPIPHSETLIDLYQRSNPAVVHIRVYAGGFSLGSGSGFLVDEDRHILTNNHVVVDAEQIEIVFWNASRVWARVIGSDQDADLAVLEAESIPEGVAPLEMGDSDAVQVGESVIAIGNPFGLQGTMTQGIVSGVGRRLTSLRESELSSGSYSNPDIIQTDAAINPGNSGGPLLNLAGQVIGINTAIRSETGTGSGVGFAAPVNTIKKLLPHLIRDGRYVYPWMGIGSPQQEIDLNMMELLDLPQVTGVYVTNVTPESPADIAGLRAADPATGTGGDLITAIDNHELISFGDLVSYLVAHTEPGQVVQLTVVRAGETIQIPMTLGERP